MRSDLPDNPSTGIVQPELFQFIHVERNGLLPENIAESYNSPGGLTDMDLSVGFDTWLIYIVILPCQVRRIGKSLTLIDSSRNATQADTNRTSMISSTNIPLPVRTSYTILSLPGHLQLTESSLGGIGSRYWSGGCFGE